MKKILILALSVLSINTYALSSNIREGKLKQINDVYVKEVAEATKLKPEQVRDFLPGNKNYGKKIGEFYKLSLDQVRAVNQLEDQRKKAMFELRKRYGKERPKVMKLKAKK